MIKTRFAPSPTGPIHIGNIRVALYNWLYARHHGGKFLLRIEDTDDDRSTDEAVEQLLNALDSLGLTWDGEPVYQSRRLKAHQEAVRRLWAQGDAYRGTTRTNPLTARLGSHPSNRQGTIVFRMPKEDMSFDDEIKGHLVKPYEKPYNNEIWNAEHNDFVIQRSDETPTFHLANVVDDIFMGITHVIRGDDHIESTYRQAALYRALGSKAPKFIHLPMITNDKGRPYSKRDGTAFIGDFLDKGFLPDAMLNYLALLGWSPGNDREIMTRDKMIDAFSGDKIQVSSAQMDPKKLLWMNGQYIQRMPYKSFAAKALETLEKAGFDPRNHPHINWILRSMQTRIKTLEELPKATNYFFTDNFEYDTEALKKRTKPNTVDLLVKLLVAFDKLTNFNEDQIEAALRSVASDNKSGAGTLIHPVRLAVSGRPNGPSLFGMLSALGKIKTQERLGRLISHIEGV